MLQLTLLGREVRPILPYLVLGGGAAMALITTLPALMPLPGIDSGIFLYVGRQMLHGMVPYRDLWENKPPGIYLIDALGLAIGNGSRWGICLLEWISLWAAASMGFAALCRVFGVGPALFASFCWIAGFARALQGGNLAEEFVLPVQFASLIVFSRIAASGVRITDGVLLGMFAAIAAIFKPNTMGLWIAIGLWSIASSWVYRRWLPSLLLAAGAALGACATIAPVALFFYRNHALGGLIDQAFRYNFIYIASSTWIGRAHCAYTQFIYFAPSGLSLTVLGAWVAALYLLVFRRVLLGPVVTNFVALAAIALPIETALACTSADIYLHHFIVPFACWAILFAFAAWLGASRARAINHRDFGRLPRAAVFIAIALLAWIGAWRATYRAARDPDQPRTAILRYISSHSRADDFVLTWGLTAALDFAAGRLEPSRFLHEFPLCTRGYTDPGKIALFLDDLNRHPPLLIVDSSAQSGLLPPLDPAARAVWLSEGTQGWRAQLNEMMEPVFGYVQRNYRESYTDSSARWKVYRRIDRANLS